MRSSLWEGLLKNHEPRLKPPYPTSCFGDKIGTLDSGDDYWEITGDLRTQYYTTIHPKLHELLLAIFGTASISDWITLPVYMVGKTRTNALPTVMVCSEDENARKKAKKEIKKSGFLQSHAKFKVLSVEEDPGMRNMEQLASDADKRKPKLAVERATEVLIDISKPVQPLGMQIWVDHDSSLRPATAFVTQIAGRTFLRTVDHAFVRTTSPGKKTSSTRQTAIHVDSDSDSDSEDDSEDDDDELDVAITSIGSQSPDTYSDTGSDSGESSASRVFSGKSTPNADYSEHPVSESVYSDLQEVASRLVPLASSPPTYIPKETVQPHKDTLVSLGKLTYWSTDTDWALITITNKEFMSAFEQSITKATPGMHVAELRDDAQIVTYTSSGGRLSGVFSGLPFCTRLPNSTSFRDVHRVHLNGALANGDCGSAVRDSTTGELYGHIVAGCRATGAAYIMAAHQIEADFVTLTTKIEPSPTHTFNHVQPLVKDSAATPSPTSSTFGWVSYHPDVHTNSLVPLGTKESKSRRLRGRTRPLTAEQRRNAALMRGAGACQSCKRRKVKNDPGTPCKSCLDHYKSDLLNAPATRKIDEAIPPPVLSLVDELALQLDTEMTEPVDSQRPSRFSMILFLYWTGHLVLLLLTLLSLGNKLWKIQPKPKPAHLTTIYYGLLLAPMMLCFLSANFGVFVNTAFAVLKLGLLATIVIIGFIRASRRPDPDPGSCASPVQSKTISWILPFMALLAQLPYESKSLTRHATIMLPFLQTRRLLRLVHIVGSPLEAMSAYLMHSRMKSIAFNGGEMHSRLPIDIVLRSNSNVFIAISGLFGALFFWSSGRTTSVTNYVWKYSSGLSSSLVVVSGTLLFFAIQRYISKQHQDCNLKLDTMGQKRSLDFKPTFWIVTGTGLSILSIRILGTLLSGDISRSSASSQLWKEIHFQSEFVCVLVASVLVFLIQVAILMQTITLEWWTRSSLHCEHTHMSFSFTMCIVAYAYLGISIEMISSSNVAGEDPSREYLPRPQHPHPLLILIMGLVSQSLHEMTTYLPCTSFFRISPLNRIQLFLCVFIQWAPGLWTLMPENMSDIFVGKLASTYTIPTMILVAGFLILSSIKWSQSQPPPKIHIKNSAWSDDFQLQSQGLWDSKVKENLMVSFVQAKDRPGVPERRVEFSPQGNHDNNTRISSDTTEHHVMFPFKDDRDRNLNQKGKLIWCQSMLVLLRLISYLDIIGLLAAYITNLWPNWCKRVIRIPYASTVVTSLWIFGFLMFISGPMEFSNNDRRPDHIPLVVILPMSLLWGILFLNANQDHQSRQKRGSARQRSIPSLPGLGTCVFVLWAGYTLVSEPFDNPAFILNVIHRSSLELGPLALILLIIQNIFVFMFVLTILRNQHDHGKNMQVLDPNSEPKENAIPEKHRSKLNVCWERLSSMDYVTYRAICLSAFVAVLHICVVFHSAIKYPFEEFLTDMVSLKVGHPLWVSIFKAYSAPVIFIALLWAWKMFHRPYLDLDDSVRRFKALEKHLLGPLLEDEDRSRPFTPSITRPKAYLGTTICLSIVITMGINSFLMKEVENWKRTECISAVSLCHLISQSFTIARLLMRENYEQSRKRMSHLEELKKQVSDLKQFLEDSRWKTLGVDDGAETFLGDEEKRKILQALKSENGEARRHPSGLDAVPFTRLQNPDDRETRNRGYMREAPPGRINHYFKFPISKEPPLESLHMGKNSDLDWKEALGSPPNDMKVESDGGTPHDSEHDRQQRPSFLYPTKEISVLCISIVVTMGINAFLLREVENWKRPAMEYPTEPWAMFEPYSLEVKPTSSKDVPAGYAETGHIKKAKGDSKV